MLYIAPVNYLCPWSRFMDDVDGNECVPHREWLVMFDEVLKEVKEDLQKQGREDEFIGAKVSVGLSRDDDIA